MELEVSSRGTDGITQRTNTATTAPKGIGRGSAESESHRIRVRLRRESSLLAQMTMAVPTESPYLHGCCAGRTKRATYRKSRCAMGYKAAS